MKSYIYDPQADITPLQQARLEIFLHRHLNGSPSVDTTLFGVLGGDEIKDEVEMLPRELRRHIKIEEYKEHNA